MNEQELNELTKGNEFAARFIVTYIAFCHLLDDIHDKDKDVTDQRIVLEMMMFLEQISLNPWVREHIHSLWPLIVASANSWLDANRWEKDIDHHKRRSSDVLKGQYHEVIWFIAYLCGGFQHQQNITTRFRDYDYDNQE
jgi:hypothetical protein